MNGSVSGSLQGHWGNRSVSHDSCDVQENVQVA